MFTIMWITCKQQVHICPAQQVRTVYVQLCHEIVGNSLSILSRLAVMQDNLKPSTNHKSHIFQLSCEQQFVLRTTQHTSILMYVQQVNLGQLLSPDFPHPFVLTENHWGSVAQVSTGQMPFLPSSKQYPWRTKLLHLHEKWTALALLVSRTTTPD